MPRGQSSPPGLGLTVLWQQRVTRPPGQGPTCPEILCPTPAPPVGGASKQGSLHSGQRYGLLMWVSGFTADLVLSGTATSASLVSRAARVQSPPPTDESNVADHGNQNREPAISIQAPTPQLHLECARTKHSTERHPQTRAIKIKNHWPLAGLQGSKRHTEN